nr:hydrocephalus-inducing protein-like [Taeniopygia guttata]
MLFSRFIPSPPTFKPKKKAALPRTYSKPESVEEPTKTPERMQDSAQQPADAEVSLEAEGLSSPAGESQRPGRMRGLSQFSKMEHPKVGMQEVFDVRPVWGELEPGESELVTFTFFGHANIIARVRALCHVEGGPTYEVVVSGQASCPSFQLDVEEIDWGLQVPQASPGTAPCLGITATSMPGSLPFSAPCWLWGLEYNPGEICPASKLVCNGHVHPSPPFPPAEGQDTALFKAPNSASWGTQGSQ